MKLKRPCFCAIDRLARASRPEDSDPPAPGAGPDITRAASRSTRSHASGGSRARPASGRGFWSGSARGHAGGGGHDASPVVSISLGGDRFGFRGRRAGPFFPVAAGPDRTARPKGKFTLCQVLGAAGGSSSVAPDPGTPSRLALAKRARSKRPLWAANPGPAARDPAAAQGPPGAAGELTSSVWARRRRDLGCPMSAACAPGRPGKMSCGIVNAHPHPGPTLDPGAAFSGREPPIVLDGFLPGTVLGRARRKEGYRRPPACHCPPPFRGRGPGHPPLAGHL